VPTSVELVLSLYSLEDSVKADLLALDGHLATCLSPWESLHQLRQDARRLQSGSASSKDVEWFGRLVADVACGADVREALVQALAQHAVRLRLRVADELTDIPWEFLYVPESGIGFVAQNPGVRISRDSRKPAPAVVAKGAISVLLVYADPQSMKYPALAGLENELNSIRDALIGQEHRRIKIDVLRHATPNSLYRQMESNRYDVFHFLGHADLRPSGGLLVLEGHMPREHAEIYGEDLASMLLRAGVKLVCLSGCDSNGHTTSIGGHLADASIPAVVGMQLPVADVDALLFARTFYSALSSAASLEEATYQGRMAIRGSGVDWAAPVLTTSCPDMTLVSLDAKPMRGNLPKPITSFIGRAKEIETVCEVLETERLIVLLGSGGIGKTRLSIEIGRQSAPRFANGVWQVPLENVTDNDKVLESIARVFGIHDSSEKPIEERLFEFLASQELLLILDNCEQVVAACRDAAVRILSECPGVKILATSRVVLDTGAESIIAVPSLSYPFVPDEDVPVFPVDETIEKYEALQLLCARAKSANSKFSPNEKNIEALCRIAQRVDGIPLALELAASQVRSHSPKEVLDLLINDPSWLDKKNPGKTPRHETLRATLDWSYRLLPPDEQSFFNQLSVFAGTFSLEAAEAVAVVDSGLKVADLVSGLVDKSLVVAEDTEIGTRYHLLETCRVYAREGLDAAETDRAMSRFLDYCVALSERLYQLEVSLDLVAWQAAIKPEQDNLLAALEWAVSNGHAPAKAGKIVVWVIDYWLMIGFVRQAAKIIDRILETLPNDEIELQVRLNVLAGTLSIYAGDHSGLERIKAAHKRAIDAGDSRLQRYAASRLGECAYELMDEETAIEMFSWVIKHCEEIGDPKMEGYVRLWLSNIEIHRGEYERAARHLSEMIEARTRLNDIRGIGVASCTQAYLEQRKGSARATSLYNDGLAKLAQIEDIFWIACFMNLASGLLGRKTLTHAASIQGFAQRMREDSGTSYEPYMRIWIAEIHERTKQSLGTEYEYWFSEGRTMTVEEALTRLNSAFSVMGRDEKSAG